MVFKKVLRILSLNNLRRYEAWVRHQVGDSFFQDDNYRILLTTALSFKVEVMMYCSLPDSLRIVYFFIIECQRVTLLLKSIFVIFGEENVKVR